MSTLSDAEGVILRKAAELRQGGQMSGAEVFVLREPDGFRVKVRSGSVAVGPLVDGLARTFAYACQQLGLVVKIG